MLTIVPESVSLSLSACVYECTCQHYAEHESREVVVEIEDTTHHVERKVVQRPANQQPQTTRREHRQFGCTRRREREGVGDWYNTVGEGREGGREGGRGGRGV